MHHTESYRKILVTETEAKKTNTNKQQITLGHATMIMAPVLLKLAILPLSNPVPTKICCHNDHRTSKWGNGPEYDSFSLTWHPSGDHSPGRSCWSEGRADCGAGGSWDTGGPRRWVEMCCSTAVGCCYWSHCGNHCLDHPSRCLDHCLHTYTQIKDTFVFIKKTDKTWHVHKYVMTWCYLRSVLYWPWSQGIRRPFRGINQDIKTYIKTWSCQNTYRWKDLTVKVLYLVTVLH